MKNRFKLGGGIACVLLLGAFVGCSAADTSSDSVDCGGVCQRYSECFDADYDTEGCTDRCESDAGASEDGQGRLRMCDDCMGDRSCTEATLNCADDCAGM